MIIAQTILLTKYGKFKVSYHQFKNKFCISFSKGQLDKKIPIVRIHSSCLFGEAFHSMHCDCDYQLTQTMKLIEENKAGIIIYSYNEGRGIGLKRKIQTMEIERTKKVDTVEAFKFLGFKKSDYRDYKIEVRALRELKINRKIRTFSGNPQKLEALKGGGFKVIELISGEPLDISILAKKERLTKQEKMGYVY